MVNETKHNKTSNSSDFVQQAGILAAAGIISRLIGVIYRVPLANILTNEGNGYYSSAYNMYVMILLISSYSIPSAISKIISGKLEQREYQNAQRIFYGALMYVAVVGTAASLFLFFGASLLLEGDAALVLKVFAPTVLFYGFLGVLRGYFQAHKSMVQTSLSQIFEQIANCIVSLSAAYLFMSMYQEPQFGAMGSALGTSAGVVTALLFMLFVYKVNSRYIRKRLKRDRHTNVMKYDEVIRNIILIVTPIIISTFIYNLCGILNNKLFITIAISKLGLSEEASYSIYGIFSAKAVILSDVPIALATAMSAALIPVVSGAYTSKGHEAASIHVKKAIHITMLLAIPAAVGMGILAKPIISLIFNIGDELAMATTLLQMMSATIAFYSLSTLSNGILQGIGLVNKPVRNAAVALAIQTGVVTSLLLFTDFSIYALPVGFLIYSSTICILNQLSIRKALHMKLPILQSLVKPTISALVMGVIVLLLYKGIEYVLPNNLVIVTFGVFIGGCVYGVVMLLIGGITEDDLYTIPKGRMLVPILRRVGLLRR